MVDMLEVDKAAQLRRALAEHLGQRDAATGEVLHDDESGLIPGRHIVITGGNLPEQVHWLDCALGQGHYVYSRGATLVQIVPADAAPSDGVARAPRAMVAAPVSAATIRTLFGRQVFGLDAEGRRRPDDAEPAFAMYRARVRRVRGGEPEVSYVLSDAPKEAAAAFRELGHWDRVRKLRGISRWPLLAKDGAISAKSGYDYRTMYYIADDAGFGAAGPVTPMNKQELRAQVDALFADELRDVAFASEDDKAAYLAALLTPMVVAIAGVRPPFILDAPTVGSGKTLAAQAIGTIYTGEPIPVNPLSGEEEERRKTVMSLLLAADAFVLFDNVKGVIGGETLSALTTSPFYSDRKLGASETARLEVSFMVLITANNAQTDSDFARRAVRVRLDPKVENTMSRTFTYPDIHATLAARREKLLRLFATILVSYGAVQQREAPTHVVPFPGYNVWAKKVRDAVVWLGFNDFVARTAREFEEANPELEGLAAGLAALRRAFGTQEFTAATVLAQVGAGFDTWDSEFGAAVLGAFGGGRDRTLNVLQLAKALAARRDRIAGGLVLRHAGGGGSRPRTFRVDEAAANEAAR